MTRRGYALTLFLVLLLCYSYFFPRWADWAQNSRMDLVLAIVDQGTLRIDDYYTNTGDYAYFEGHYYTDKSPGSSFLAVPVYALYKAVASLPPVVSAMERVGQSEAFAPTLSEGGAGTSIDRVYFAGALYAVTFIVVAIPSALLGVALFYFAAAFANRDAYAFWVALAYGLATPAFAYSSFFGQHQTSGGAAFLSFWLLYRMKQGKAGRWVLWVTGALFGLALITEYTIALILAPIFFYALYALDNKWTVWRMFAAALPFGLALAAYNLAIFRTPLPVGYLYSPNYTELHYQGFLSLTYPKLPALWGITFSPYRGLFFISPFLLLGFLGLWYMHRRRTHRAEWWVMVFSVLSFFLYNASSAMWEGGHAVGPRYLVPMLPFLSMPIVLVFNRWAATRQRPGGPPVAHRWVTAGIGGLMALSGALVWAQTIGGQHFPGWVTNPLVEWSLPRLLEGDIARNLGMLLGLKGWWSLAPLALLVALLLVGIPQVKRLTHRTELAPAAHPD